MGRAPRVLYAAQVLIVARAGARSVVDALKLLRGVLEAERITAAGVGMMADTTKHGHAGDGSGRGRVPLVADVPLRDPELDGFGFVVFANALALVVDHERTATPLTIAVSAPWGGGKSSVGGMTQTLLERRVARRRGDEPRLVVWFNAWDHEDASHLGGALAGAVAREASRHRSWWRRALFPLPSAMRDAREGLRATLVLGALSLALAGLLMALPPTRDLTVGLLGEEALAGGVGTVGVLFVATLLFQRVFATARSAAQFIDDPRSAAARGSMADVKHQFGTLIRHATRDGRLVILVDDLDRCESARALEVCRVASQLLAHEGVVTILLADMTSISASASIRFAADNGADSAEAAEVADDVGRRYLEKIVQIELAVPPPDPVDMRAASSGYSDFLRASPSSADADDRNPQQAGLTALMRATGAVGRRGLVPWQTVIRWVEQAKWWPALVGISAAFGLVAALSPAEGDEYAPDWSIDVLMVTTLVTLAVGVWSSTLRRRHRRRGESYKLARVASIVSRPRADLTARPEVSLATDGRYSTRRLKTIT